MSLRQKFYSENYKHNITSAEPCHILYAPTHQLVLSQQQKSSK